jgi:hypothetical protein
MRLSLLQLLALLGWRTLAAAATGSAWGSSSTWGSPGSGPPPAIGAAGTVAAAAAATPHNFSSEEIVDVTHFGARGDGRHDDTAAIQRALDAGVGRVVFFPHTGPSESKAAAYVISATLETDKNGPVSILGGAGTEEAVFIVWNGPSNGTMLRWNSGWGRMTGINLYSGSALPGIVMHIGYNPSNTTAVSIEDVEFEHCVFGGGEYMVNATTSSGGGRIAGVQLGSFNLNGLDDDIATVKFRHCRFDTNYDSVVWQSTNALNIDFDSCVFHKARGNLPDHDVRSHIRMVRGGSASFTNPYFGCLGLSGLSDAAIHIWSGWVSVTKAECESSTGGGGFLWMENNTVSAVPSVGTTSIHEVDRPSVITASRLAAKAIYGKEAPIVLSPGSSPVVLMGNWMNYRVEAEFNGPWVQIEQPSSLSPPETLPSYVTSIGNTYWTTQPSPFAISNSNHAGGGRGGGLTVTSEGDLVTADYGRTLSPLAAIVSHVLTVTTSPFVISGTWDDFHVDTGDVGGGGGDNDAAFHVTLPAAVGQWGRKLTVTHTAGLAPLTLHAAVASTAVAAAAGGTGGTGGTGGGGGAPVGDGIAGKAQVALPALYDSITLQSDGQHQWLVLASSTSRAAGQYTE